MVSYRGARRVVRYLAVWKWVFVALYLLAGAAAAGTIEKGTTLPRAYEVVVAVVALALAGWTWTVVAWLQWMLAAQINGDSRGPWNKHIHSKALTKEPV